MAEPLEKPRRKPGTFCPLWRKDVSKVCHTCDWWSSILVQKADEPPYDHWACALNLANVIMRDVGFGVAGVQSATESFRNVHTDISTTALRAAIGALQFTAQGSHANGLSALAPRLIGKGDGQ